MRRDGSHSSSARHSREPCFASIKARSRPFGRWDIEAQRPSFSEARQYSSMTMAFRFLDFRTYRFVPFAFASAFSPFATNPPHTHTHSCTRLNPCKEIISKQWLATAPSTVCLVSAQSTQNDTDKYHARDKCGTAANGSPARTRPVRNKRKFRLGALTANAHLVVCSAICCC